MIIDASNLILGRLATYVAKQALLGNDVKVINCEKAVISGRKEVVFADFLHRMSMGSPRKGPYVHRMPDKIVRRAIRGMLPFKKSRGKEAYKKVLCYYGVPEELKNQKAITIESANITKLPTLKYVDIYTLSKRLGAKVE
jgi:large subunit ribosomal protein L13